MDTIRIRELKLLSQYQIASKQENHNLKTELFPLMIPFSLISQYIYLFIYLFIYLWLCWVFVSVRGLPLAAASGGHSSSRCTGLSLLRPLLLWSTGSRRAGSVVVAHGSSCSVACGIFPDQGSNPCPLHWQADPQPLRHQGSPVFTNFLKAIWKKNFAQELTQDQCVEN